MASAPDLYMRVRNLPGQIESAEKKLRRLYLEAQQYRLHDLVHYPVFVNEAWDREVEVAKLEAAGREGAP
jgi:hypothetical protein